MNTIDRRALLLGTAGGLLVSACGGSDGGTTRTKGPNIVKPDTGTVVTTEDTAALTARLNKAFESRDVDQLINVVDPNASGLDFVREWWGRRYDNFERLDFITGEWYVGVPAGRTRNAAGGQVEYDGDLVFASTVAGCDAQQVVETYRASFRKTSDDAPLELMNLGEPSENYLPAFWDVAKIDVIETKHACVAFRAKDADRAKTFRDRIEKGAASAFSFMPNPQGVTKVFYALTWPGIDGELYGGVGIGEADAHAYLHRFVDPAELASGQETPATGAGLSKATGRVGLHQGSFTRSDFQETAAHEAIHVLANQWYTDGGAPSWVAEGLATWGARGGTSGLMTRDGGRIRSYFGTFAKRALKGYDEFHQHSHEYEMYVCSAAVYAYLEHEGGKDAAFELAEAFYGAPSRSDAAKKLGRSEKELFAATRKWLRS